MTPESPIAIDFESFYSTKLKYGVRQMIAEQYCRDARFECYMVSVSDGVNSWAGSPADFNWETLHGRTLLSHNSYFDRSVFAELQRRGLAPATVIPADWHCTANLTAYLANRRALADAVEFLLGRKVDKSARSEADGKHWPADFTDAEQRKMLEYARGDATDCWLLWDKFSSRWPALERRLSNQTIEQGMRGVQIDVALLNRYLIETHGALLKTQSVLPWLSADPDEDWDDFKVKPTSTKCIAEQCRRVGIPCPPVKSDDEELFEEWETTYANTHAWIPALSSWRSINKLYKTLCTMKARLRSDGTLPFALKYFGAHTGRWSGDAKINFQNFRKVPLFINEIGLMETGKLRIKEAVDGRAAGALPAWCSAAIDFRNLIIPRPGCRMIVSDLSQIEPRVLAWLAGDFAFLKLVSEGISVYEAHARVSMNFTGSNLKKTDPTLYSTAKASRLALGYQAGWEKFIVMAWDLAGFDVTAGDPEWVEVEDELTGTVSKVSGYGTNSKRIVSEFRANNQKIVDLWETLDAGFKRSVGSDFTITLPSGRALTYEKVRAEWRVESDRKTGKPRRKTVFTAQVGFRREQRYGGKLTENATQAVAREVFGEHLVRLERPGVWVLFSSHDEAILEVSDATTPRDIEATMSYCPPWLAGCPIAAEAHEVPCYTK